MTDTHPTDDRRPLRWTIGLLLFLAIAAPLVWLAGEVHRARQTWLLTANLQRQGCYVSTAPATGAQALLDDLANRSISTGFVRSVGSTPTEQNSPTPTWPGSQA